MNAIKTILVPVDFSTGSRSALEQASRLAGLNGASLHVLHVVDAAAVASQADSRNTSFERQATTSAEGARDALVRWLAQAGAPAGCQSTIVVGVPLNEILEHIKTQNPDLVVSGITGAGESKAGAGSLAHRLARQVPGKILLVRTYHPNAFQKIVAFIDFSETSREVASQAHRIAIQDGAKVDFLHGWQEPWLSTPYAYLAAVTTEFIEHRRQLLSTTLPKARVGNRAGHRIQRGADERTELRQRQRHRRACRADRGRLDRDRCPRSNQPALHTHGIDG